MTSAPQSLTFVAALSFEQRCIGAFSALARKKRDIDAVFLDYGSEATSGSVAAGRRNAHWKEIREIAKRQAWNVHRVSSDPYSMTRFNEQVAEAITDPARRVVIDITCMPKSHTLSAATWLAAHAPERWSIAYTTPNNYGSVHKAHQAGLRGTLTLPLGAHPSLRNEGLSLGLLLAGAEAERALVAMEELEPSAGVAALVTRRDRPDFHESTFSRNSSLFDYLGRLRLSGPRVLEEDFAALWPSLGWVFRELANEQLVRDVSQTVARLVEGARTLDAPLILYPFGPKDAVFIAAYLMASDYPEASWAIYPVLATHPLDYSEGIRGTRWLSSSDMNANIPAT